MSEFFDLDDDLNEELIANNTNIAWYSHTNMSASGDYIRAVSKYYNEPEFSDVSINMNVEEVEDYNTNEGTCFGKVLFISLFISLFTVGHCTDQACLLNILLNMLPFY